LWKASLSWFGDAKSHAASPTEASRLAARDRGAACTCAFARFAWSAIASEYGIITVVPTGTPTSSAEIGPSVTVTGGLPMAVASLPLPPPEESSSCPRLPQSLPSGPVIVKSMPACVCDEEQPDLAQMFCVSVGVEEPAQKSLKQEREQGRGKRRESSEEFYLGPY
jgi:hypothetical protein